MIALGLHSHFSLMQGTAGPRALCRDVREKGYGTLALTDTDNLYGLWPYLAACEQEGIRPIIGSEIRAGSYRLFCLAKDLDGYRNLCRLLTARHCEPGFDLASSLSTRHSGLVCLTPDRDLLRHCREIGAETYAAICGQPNQHNSELRRLARSLGLSAAAVQDSFFLSPDDAPVHRLLRAIDRNSSLCRLPQHEMLTMSSSFPAADEWRQRFNLWPECLSAAGRIAERCALRTPFAGLIMPPWPAEDPDAQLRTLAYAGARNRYDTPLAPAVTARLEHELAIIASMRFSSYFLVVHEIVGPVARTCGRGSGAASLVAYCLGITNVCPIRHNLYFERFLNPGRTDPPDIDIDFAWDERDQILASVLNRFGCHAAMVANHVTLQPRMAIRETAKVFGIPGGEISRITKKIPWIWRTDTAEDGYLEQLQRLPQLRGADLSDPWPEILRLAARISGVPRCLSVHPGGVIITPGPMCDHAPVQRAAKGVPIIQWEKDGAEEAGLVKIDLLGNRSLGVIRDAIDQVRRNGSTMDERRWIPEDDPATQDMVARGRTMGCFYIESPATRLLQQRSRHGDFEHVVLHSSIIRPAANEFIREYLRRLHGGAWEPLHPLVGGVLDETYGIMVYQEDVSRVAVAFGFSHADADRLRKIMSKKDKERQLRDYRERFFQAAAERGVNKEATGRIWAMMMSFDGYSFCKPHSASYARVSFQSAYLKAHYPAEFMAAVISNQGGFYSTFAYVSEARRLGLTILRPDANASEVSWQGQGKYLRVGLMAVAGLGSATAARVVTEARRRPFVSVFDFLGRVQPSVDESEALVHAGVLDGFQSIATANRGVLIWLLASWRKSTKQTGSLFPLDPAPPRLPPEDRLQRLRNEYRVLGFLCEHHPVTLFAPQRRQAGALTARELLSLPDRFISQRRPVRFLGWLITGKIVGTKKGDLMEFLSFEDETNLVECTLFAREYERYCHLLDRRGPLLLDGYLEEDFGARTLTIQQIAVPPRAIIQGG
ncbi:DNA polymerase III subunit alpha [Desulfobulbus oligotrophicus]|uniref:DNA-directed DNA polymerase n=1 Tax=Desulfobulbus oligotrophicus TaxID=1909699 RepID=A0A7T5VB52_9BACT|nr:DNA polymerase III subunit alpha [Desulfobulbus oligotrophicus]QQG64624.1 DNA polymerase III subunit alpha [Desulfobulbus oligotrophicus]